MICACRELSAKKKRGRFRMKIRERISNAVWILFLCAAAFMTAAAVWIRKTYGTLLFATANASFRNGFQNKRTLFAKEVVLPTMAVGIILGMVHVLWKKRNRRRITCIAAALMILSLLGAMVTLDAGAYLARVYRLGREQWYDKNDVVIHALGTVDGMTYTNAKEALEDSYQNGKRVLECDLIMTSDGQIAACHDWEYWNREINNSSNVNTAYIPTLAEFMSCKIAGKYTPLSGDDIVLYMKEHPDLYIVTDTKYAEPEEIRAQFGALVDTAGRNGCSGVLDRFVVQIYHSYMHGIVNEIYPFPHYIYTLYQEGFRGEEDRIQEYAEFCMLNKIDVITMNAQYYHEELAEICSRYGLELFVHTVNDKEEIASYLDSGVGVYTDHP